MPKGTFIRTRKEIDMNYVIQELTKGKKVKALAAELGTNRETLYSRLRELGIHDTQQFRFDHNYFANINTEEKAYWLGFLMADGCVSMTANPKIVLKLAIIDEMHIGKWHKALGSVQKPCIYKDAGRQYIASTHPSKTMCQDLIRLGCTAAKSLTLAFPDIDHKYVRHFIRGYMDGDGCIYVIRKEQCFPQIRVNFIGTKCFLSTLQNLIGTNKKMRLIGNNKYNYSFDISGNNEAMHLLNWLYADATIYLDRKYVLYEQHKKLMESR